MTTPHSADALKPCPFCGGQPKIHAKELDERYAYANEVKVQCSSCGVSVTAVGDTSKPGYADNSTTEKRAIAAWNRRPTPASPDLVELRKLLTQQIDCRLDDEVESKLATDCLALLDRVERAEADAKHYSMGADAEVKSADEWRERALRAESAARAVPEGLRRIGELLRTQDNRITDQPMFIVQQKRRITGLDTDYCDNIVWLATENDYSEASAEEAARLEAEYQESLKVPQGWMRTGYHDYWEFVTACFTEQGCKDYLARDGHNLKEPRIYAEGSYRNEEYRTVRNWLLSLAAAPPAQGLPAAPDDPMDWRLPCDVKVGSGTHKKGTTLRSLVSRMEMLHGMAMKAHPVDEAKAAEFRAFLDQQFGSSPPAAAPSEPVAWMRPAAMEPEFTSDAVVAGYWMRKGSTVTPLAQFATPPAQDAGTGATVWKELLEAVVREMPKRAGRNGNAPGHAHKVPGIWDSDNGALAGQPCAWCIAWNGALRAIANSGRTE